MGSPVVQRKTRQGVVVQHPAHERQPVRVAGGDGLFDQPGRQHPLNAREEGGEGTGCGLADLVNGFVC